MWPRETWLGRRPWKVLEEFLVSSFANHLGGLCNPLSRDARPTNQVEDAGSREKFGTVGTKTVREAVALRRNPPLRLIFEAVALQNHRRRVGHSGRHVSIMG